MKNLITLLISGMLTLNPLNNSITKDALLLEKTISQLKKGNEEKKEGYVHKSFSNKNNGYYFAYEFPNELEINKTTYDLAAISYILGKNKEKRFSTTFIDYDKRELIIIYDGLLNKLDGVPDAKVEIKPVGILQAIELSSSYKEGDPKKIFKENIKSHITEKDKIYFQKILNEFLKKENNHKN